MEQWSSLWSGVATSLGPYAPRWLGALAIVLAAWLAGRLVRLAALRVATKGRVEERLKTPGLAQTLASIAHAGVWLLALPALLDALGLRGLLEPVNAMLAKLLGVLPGILGGVVVFGVGWFAARILRQLVIGLLKAAGSERLAERIGVHTALGEPGLAGLAGSAVFVLVLLPTVTAALQALGLEVVARPVGHLMDQVIELLPRLISAAIIVALFVLLGRLLAGLVTTLLASAGLNTLPARLGMPADLRIGGRDPSELAGGVVMTAALLLGVTQGFDVLGLSVLSEAMIALSGVLSRALVALVVLGAGLWIGAVTSRVLGATTLVHAPLLGRLAYAATVFFSAALALRQAGLPADIIGIAFGAIVGALALAAAIALGFGGRDVAQRLLEAAVASFEREKGRAQGGSR